MIVKKDDSRSIEAAAACLRRGELVVLPTDTIYGFSALVPDGAQKIINAKGRDEGKPFIQLIAEPKDILTLSCGNFNHELISLWPAAVTFIVETADNTTTAFRCPDNNWLRSVIAETGSPIYSTSVNRSGEQAITDIQSIIREFGSIADCIVDAGELPAMPASTIVDTVRGIVIRQGSVHIPEELLRKD